MSDLEAAGHIADLEELGHTVLLAAEELHSRQEEDQLPLTLMRAVEQQLVLAGQVGLGFNIHPLRVFVCACAEA